MKSDMLLDAFGLIDDRFLVEDTKQMISWRRRAAILAAAVLIVAMSMVTAMAVSEDFRSFVFSVFRIGTQEQAPVAEETLPTAPGLYEMDIVNIDGEVNAWYFSSGAYVMPCEGGFYTSQWPLNGSAPVDPAFWEIAYDGVREVKNTRVDFPFTHGGKTFRILFDCAVLNGKLSVQVWPEGLNENPVANGWNVETIGSRTDTALMTIPVLSENDYTHDLFLLDLTTLETTPLITDMTDHGIIAYAYQVTDDLRYASIAGIDLESGSYGYWLWDAESKDVQKLDADDAYFLDNSFVILRKNKDQDHFDLIRLHIPTGTERIILENVTSRSGRNSGYRPIQNHWAGGRHGLLFREDGSVDLIDFRTEEILKLNGLDAENLTCDESPDGRRIMLAHEDENGFRSLGILDPETGVLKLLDREISGGSESFRGWLDNDTLVITAHDIPNAELDFTQGDSYYVYVYRFLDEEDTQS